MSIQVVLEPIDIRVTQGDTQPSCTWTFYQSDGKTPQDMTVVGRSATLYYRDLSGRTLWKLVLANDGTNSGKVTYAADVSHAFCPTTGLTAQEFRGSIHYVDSGTGASKWYEDALKVTADPAPTEPA